MAHLVGLYHSYHSNNMLFYCHLSPLKDNKLIISNHLVIIG